MITFVKLNINSPPKFKETFASKEVSSSPQENFGLLTFLWKLLENYCNKYKEEEENTQKAAERTHFPLLHVLTTLRIRSLAAIIALLMDTLFSEVLALDMTLCCLFKPLF